jgi:hypothetical protein
MKKTFKNLVATTIMTLATCAFFFISCNKEDPQLDIPFVDVEQTTLNAPAGGGDVTLTITANRPWKLTDNIIGDRWFTADKTEGDGNAVITFTASPNQGATREADIKIATSTVYVDVRITQSGAIATEKLYADDFGNAATASPWPSVTAYTGWNKSGIGADNVTYNSEIGTVSVRNTSPSGTYIGASGQCNVMMPASGANFLINGIDPLGITNMTLSFGSNESSTITKLYYNTGGADWTEVPYEKTTRDTWDLATANFKIPTGSTVLNLKFAAASTDNYGTRIDDIKLVGMGTSVLGDLRLSPTSLNFTATGETKSFTITSTKSWTVSSPESWATVSTNNGSGNATINVTAAANTGAQRTATITVIAGDETKTVAVTQAAASPSANAIYYEDMGKTTVTSNTDIAQFTGWSKEGSGGGNVTYSGTGNVTIRASVNSGGMYDGASGGNSVFFGTNNPTAFIVQGIELSNVNNVMLSFGASKVKNISGKGNVWDNFLSGELTLSYSSDGSTWYPVNWTLASTPEQESATNWALASAEVPTTGTSSLSLKWECTIASVVRIDDIKVVQSNGTPGNYLNISPASKAFDADGGSQTVAVTSNTNWTVTPDPAATSWCTVTPTLGSNSGAFNISVSANIGAQRAATITVRTNDNAITKTVAVTQEAPVAPQTQLSEDWTDATAGQSAAIRGWKFLKTQGDDDKTWTAASYSSNKYVQVSAHNGSAATYELWLISPPLNISGASPKVVSFDTKGGYFYSTTTLEVYILDSQETTSLASGTKLNNVRLATLTDPLTTGYTDWISSGDIDVSSFSGVKHVGFRYVAEGGASKSTTYQMDNFKFGTALTPTLDVNQTSLTLDASGTETKSFAISGNTAWTVTPSVSWLHVSPTTGQSAGVITVTADDNSGAERTATITVSGTGGVSDKTINVTQRASGSAPTFAKVEWDFTGFSAIATVTSMNATTGSGTLTTTANSGSFTQHTGKYVTTSNLKLADASWNMEIPVSGFTGGTLKLSLNPRSSNTGPRDWAVEWSANGTSWSTATDSEKYTTANADADKTITITPSGITDKLYIRLRVASSTSVNNGTVADTGTSRLTTKLTVEEE